MNINQYTTLKILGCGPNWFTNKDNVQICNIDSSFGNGNIEKGQIMSLTEGTINVHIINGFGNDLLSIFGYNIELFTLTANTINTNNVNARHHKYNDNSIVTNNNQKSNIANNNYILFKLVRTKIKK